jgi:hypothetical protein
MLQCRRSRDDDNVAPLLYSICVALFVERSRKNNFIHEFLPAIISFTCMSFVLQQSCASRAVQRKAPKRATADFWCPRERKGGVRDLLCLPIATVGTYKLCVDSIAIVV